MHRRAVERVWRRWHESLLLPSSWEIFDRPARADHPSLERKTMHLPCEVRCTRRPPFFEELAADETERSADATDGAAGERHAAGAGRERSEGSADSRLADGGLMGIEWRHAHSMAILKFVNSSISPRALQRVGTVADLRTLQVCDAHAHLNSYAPGHPYVQAPPPMGL